MIAPKDDIWWEDMDRDAQEYLASCDDQEKRGDDNASG